MKTARLSIWIKGKPVLQGKFYYREKRATFLVNIDDAKLFRTFNGYAIADQILKAFERAKVRPQILFKHVTRGITYLTNRACFQKKGILVDFGNHKQWCLPLKNWTTFKEPLEEPFDLPALTTDEWLKGPKVKIIEDFSVPVTLGMKLREEATKQGWYKPLDKRIERIKI